MCFCNAGCYAIREWANRLWIQHHSGMGKGPKTRGKLTHSVSVVIFSVSLSGLGVRCPLGFFLCLFLVGAFEVIALGSTAVPLTEFNDKRSVLRHEYASVSKW